MDRTKHKVSKGGVLKFITSPYNKAWDSPVHLLSKLIVTAAFIHIVRAFVIQFMRPLSL